MGAIPAIHSPLNARLETFDRQTGRVVLAPRRTKIALLGMARGYWLAPFDDPAWEIWGCNAGWHLAIDREGRFRADRWFEMHPLTVPPQTDTDLLRLHESPVVVYVPEVPDAAAVPTGVRYPLRWVQQDTPPQAPYFTCTFAYEMALALAEGATTIGLFGIDLVQGSPRERLLEAPCVAYWVGYAQGRGVEVVRDVYSGLGRVPYLYGIQYWDDLAWGKHQVQQMDLAIQEYAE